MWDENRADGVLKKNNSIHAESLDFEKKLIRIGIKRRHISSYIPGAVYISPNKPVYDGKMVRLYPNGELDIQTSPGVWLDMDPETIKKMAKSMPDLPFSAEVVMMMNLVHDDNR